MAENPKASWPKTPDGTIDWEVVFEAPGTGFVALISQAQTPDVLKTASTLIIEKLFTRKNDTDDRDILIAQLTAIIAGGGPIEGMIEQTTRLLRSIKDERIEKARVYIERKQAGAAIDRRAGLLWKIDKLLAPKVLIPVGAVLVLALSSIVYFTLNATLGPTTSAPSVDIADTTSSAQKDNATGQDGEIPDDAKPPEPEPLPIWFQSVRWPPASQYSSERPQYFSVTLFVKQWAHKTEICRRLPKVMDRFYVAFSDKMPIDRKARDQEITALENEITGAINALLDEPYVLKAAVARYGTHEFSIALRPPYCKSPNVTEPKVQAPE